ncbi:ABC transporter ATP-binding protein [Arenimonas fontis]|uniref:ABC transporter ATP-binding protein n=1 Tax=Arenimonas fontis TaxID=2608255 RepID=A0A5B2Z5U8_9GAMM|nr:ABC transporter ATP-binding protein [Arenimonas fontis]KAA2284208.1 ABC transporter ATP-binding protein [Arenimonas fontis]
MNEPAPGPLAALRGAGKRYGAVHALDGVDLEVRPGEVLAVLGPNGAGKSTALGLLTGRVGADAGRVSLFGGDPRQPEIRRHIGVMLQEARLPDALRVHEHVALHSSYYGAPRPVAESLELAGLTALARRPYGALSGGEQRRVQFALALCGRPALMFVDEPTTGLDVEARRNFWQVIRRLRDEGVAIVLTTHYLEEADALADRIVLLAGGRVRAEGSPEQLKRQAAGSCVTARSHLSPEVIAAWPEAAAVQRMEGRLQVRTAQPEQLLRRWLAADPSLAGLQVQALSLEDAFLDLTRAPAAAGVRQEAIA